MSHVYGPGRLENLLGALAVALADDVVAALESVVGQGGAAAAALVQIADHPNLTLDDLRRRLGLTHSAVVRLVARLEERELVVRHPSATDARAVELRVTRNGRRLYRAVLAARGDVLSRAVEDLDGADRQSLERLLGQMLDRIPRAADHSVRLCRLCDLEGCPAETCPVEQRFLAFTAGGESRDAR